MFRERLDVALRDAESGLIPDSGTILVFGADVSVASVFPADRTVFVARRRPEFDRLSAAGCEVVAEPDRRAAASFVALPRAKAEARDTLAMASRLTDGPVVVDGQKSDGVDSIIKALRAKGEMTHVTAKAHGKLAVFEGLNLDDWAEKPREVDGFVTRAGVFSADGIDPGSAALAAVLPSDPKGVVADLGAGWGYLSRVILERPGVERVDLVEADHVALDCARENIGDPRASFVWADATTWRPQERYDAVVMNPPFHQGRKAEIELGIAFIQTAAAVLKRSGVLWMVANRQLGYEKTLNARFANVQEVGGTGAFKIIRAQTPLRRGQ